MPDLDSSLKRLQESGAQASPLRVDGCNSIWLLDDDASMLRALGRLLNSAGFHVEKFNHPVAFLSRLEQARCQVAILDVWMPDMNGLEVQASLRENSAESQEKSQQIWQFQCCSYVVRQRAALPRARGEWVAARSKACRRAFESLKS